MKALEIISMVNIGDFCSQRVGWTLRRSFNASTCFQCKTLHDYLSRHNLDNKAFAATGLKGTLLCHPFKGAHWVVFAEPFMRNAAKIHGVIPAQHLKR